MHLRKICRELVEVEAIFSTWLDKTHFSRHQLHRLNRKHKPAACTVLKPYQQLQAELGKGHHPSLPFPCPQACPLPRLGKAAAGEHGSCCAVEEDLLSQSKQ